MPDLNSVDNFIQDVSDQAAAWYSIVTQKPVIVPSAQITAQDNVATVPAGVLDTPLSSYVGGSQTGFILIAAAVVVAVLLLRR